MTGTPAIIDVGDADFGPAVLERSRQLPVVVDFWAPWCGPCRNLGPVLERIASEQAGAFVLAKVNVDEAQEVAARYGVRSIPLVLGFRDGTAVAEFMGAQPEAVVRQFVEDLMPSPADLRVAAGDEALQAGDTEGAEAAWREALTAEPRHAGALLRLARLCGISGRHAQGLELLARVSGASPEEEQAAERLAAELRTAGGAGEEGASLEALRARAEQSPTELDARLELGQALAAQRRFEEALPELLAVVEADRSFADEAARKAMLDAFEILGSDHPLTQEYRAALARVLFR